MITLLTDFGTADHFVGAMKGAILSVDPDARIVDVTHEIPAYDERDTAWLPALREVLTRAQFSLVIPTNDPSVTALQHALLMRMLGLLKVGGRLAYSTCSMEPQENINLVRAVLKEAPGWQLLEDKLILPHRDGVDGAYAALIERIA